MDYIILNAIDKPYFRGGVFMQNLMEISFDYYKVFYEVARSHSITLAASHLCLTQPTVTKYIKNLEAVLNCQLFLRSQKGVSLTPEGQRLYRQISHPCQQMGQAQEVIREYVTNQDGRITISATELTMRYFLLPFMERFQHCFPNVKLQIHAHSFPTAITSLREETSDFALSITPLDNCYDFEVTHVSDFQDILIAGSRYSYLENRILSMEEILTYPIISMETGTASRRFWDTLFEEQGYELTPNIELNSNDLIAPAAVHNLGIGLVPFKFARYYLINYGIIQLNTDFFIPKRQICLIRNPLHPLTPPVQALIHMLKGSDLDPLLSYSTDSGINL